MTQAYQQLREHALEGQRRLDGFARVRIGTAMCGMSMGAGEVLDAFRREVEASGIQCEISAVGCLGLCYIEPLVDIQMPSGPRVFYGEVSPEEVANLVKTHLVEGLPVADRALATLGTSISNGVPDLSDLDMMRGQLRIALRNVGHIDPADIDQYIAAGGYAGLDVAVSQMTPEDVREQVLTSGLRGRGGAAFPTGVKWRFLTGSSSAVKYVLCNCEEGDPGAFNDKAILESDPHTLVEGLILAGYATGASNGIVFIRHGHDGPIDRVRQAISQAYEAGLVGHNILGTSFNYEIDVSLVGDSYVSGEETALMEAIEGKRAMPRYRPPFPAAVGVWGKPSNINNVKTLAYVPEIIARGGEWFASIGTEKSSGTAILCLSGSIRRPGMVEVPMGMTLSHVLKDLGGGVPRGGQMKLLQTGGPLGGVLSAGMLETPLDFDAMSRAGAILGSGGLIIAGEDTCTVDLTRTLVAFCQYESCGKCFPCRLGMTHMLETLERICRFEGTSDDLQLMNTVGSNMASGSLCGHGQLGFNPVKSALNFFGGEFAVHIEEKRCPSGVCTGDYVTPQLSRR